MKGKPIDLTERRLKKKFLEIVNDHVMFYNQCDASFRPYHLNALDSHQVTARGMGWEDLAISINDQCNRIWNGGEPHQIIC